MQRFELDSVGEALNFDGMEALAETDASLFGAAAVVLTAAALAPAATLNADAPDLAATATIDAAVSTDTHRRSDRLKARALTDAAIAAAAAIDKIIILD
jgi:hypothetical protein